MKIERTKYYRVVLSPTETYYNVFHAAVTDKFGVNWNVVAEEAPKEMEG
jgi:PhnB protein